MQIKKMQRYLNIKSLLASGVVLLAIIVSGFGGIWNTGVAEDTAVSDEIADAVVHLKLFSNFMARYDLHLAAGKVINSGIMRDPFLIPTKTNYGLRSAAGKKRTRPNLYLKGILWDENDPSAIINKKIYKVGGQIGDYKVRSITPNEVVLASENDIFRLHIRKKPGE